MSEKGIFVDEFVIRTLGDVYDLPTEGMMERCMKELLEDMLVVRQTTALLTEMDRVSAAKENRSPYPLKWRLPDQIVWQDENGGTSILTLRIADKDILTINVKHKRHRTKKGKSVQGEFKLPARIADIPSDETVH